MDLAYIYWRVKLKMEFRINTSSPQDITLLFEASGTEFINRITTNQNLADYIEKIFLKSQRYELWIEGDLVGLLAFYRNDAAKEIYVTSISISERHQGMGNGKYLLEKLLADNSQDQINSVRLEVRIDNQKAINLYNSLNFEVKSTQNQSHMMERML
jgi:ribosomal protein S18 acetylase RimI-like enzyme